MLRRRRKTPKEDRHAPRTPHGVPRSRRRARPDTPVPAELKLPPAGLPPAEAPRKEAPRKEAPPARRSGPVRREDVVLVTGFDPFGGEAVNPSWEICNRLPRTIGGLRVETCRVPCEFRRAIEVVAEAVERHRPSVILCLGQAGSRTHVSVERVAINVDDTRVGDNAGSQPIDEPIAANGSAAYFSTLPIKAMAAAMRAAGVPAEVSNSAGTYVCNHLMYGVLHYLAGRGSAARAGFIHVPYSEEQVLEKRNTPSMSIATMAKGVEAAIAVAVSRERDIAAAEGRLD